MSLVALGFALSAGGIAACSSPPSSAAAGEVAEDTAGIRDSISGTAAASLNENRVIGLLALTHEAGANLGTLGAERGSTLQIKDFGRMIMREHAALQRDAERLAADLHLEIQPQRVEPAQAPPQLTRALLGTPDGATWDRAYVDYTLAVHDAAMENTARALAATNSPAVRTYIKSTLPIMQKHVDKALSLQKSLAAAARPAPADTGTQ